MAPTPSKVSRHGLGGRIARRELPGGSPPGKGFLLPMIGLPVFVYMAWSRRRSRLVLEAADKAPSESIEPAPLVGVGGR